MTAFNVIQTTGKTQIELLGLEVGTAFGVVFVDVLGIVLQEAKCIGHLAKVSFDTISLSEEIVHEPQFNFCSGAYPRW